MVPCTVNRDRSRHCPIFALPLALAAVRRGPTSLPFGHPDDARLITVTDAAGTPWSYTYNVVGQLMGVSTADGTTRTWTYNNNNYLLESETHPESGTTSYTYNGGVLASKTDAKGTVFVFERDGNDRVWRVTAGTSVTTVTYQPGSDNRLRTVIDGVATDFAYDDAGRLRQRTDTVDGKPFVNEFTYDASDNLEQITYPSGRKLKYAYGAENRLTRVFNPDTQANYATEFDYHPSGALRTFKAGNNIVTTQTFDPQRYWLTGITAGEMQIGYGNYDGVGNVRTITDARPAPAFGAQTFTYDALDRLQSATGAYGPITYGYDAHGNQQGANFGYDPANRFRLTSYGGLPMGYDHNGNMTTRSADTFAYTPDNLVKTATVNGVATNYAYDADAWRVKKAVAGQPTTYYVRGPNGQLLMEWTNSSPTATVREYIYAGSRLIAVIRGEVPAK